MMLRAGELQKRGMSCILLWMQGGPSPFETFSPKPGHENGGESGAIDTSVSGIQISANFPEVAKAMQHAAIIRSMTSKEGSHPRATHVLHTGYLPNASVKYPAFGSIVSQQIVRDRLDLPAFVQIGNANRNSSGGGILGIEYDPLVIPQAGKTPTNAALTTEPARYHRRLGLLSRLEADQAASGAAHEV
ncbi:MAG: DUF1501 domain-containing protein, partial [Planctomycetes bacterium]|nr:DUF1501 domain-containing protein [Planctomycetota bacterium]